MSFCSSSKTCWLTSSAAHPADLAAGGADLDEAAIVVEHFDAVAVFYDAGFLVDGGDMIAQDDLHAGDIADFENAVATVFAGEERCRKGGDDNDCTNAESRLSG